MMTCVLLTGATGFVGRHISDALRSRRIHAHTVARHSLGTDCVSGQHHVADLLDIAAARELVARVRPSHLVHAAWFAVPGEYWTSSENHRWLEASLELAKAFWSSGGHRFVFVGTCAQYTWSQPVCREFVTPTVPASLYGQCKQAVESGLELAAAQYGGSAASARLFFPYGTYERPERLVPSVIRCLSRGEVAVCSLGTQARDFIYGRDVGDAIVSLAMSNLEGPVNVASGEALTVRDLATRIGRKMGREELLRFERPVSSSEPSVLIADVRRLTSDLGWRPKFDIDSGLDAAIDWWRERG